MKKTPEHYVKQGRVDYAEFLMENSTLTAAGTLVIPRRLVDVMRGMIDERAAQRATVNITDPDDED